MTQNEKICAEICAELRNGICIGKYTPSMKRIEISDELTPPSDADVLAFMRGEESLSFNAARANLILKLKLERNAAIALRADYDKQALEGVNRFLADAAAAFGITGSVLEPCISSYFKRNPFLRKDPVLILKLYPVLISALNPVLEGYTLNEMNTPFGKTDAELSKAFLRIYKKVRKGCYSSTSKHKAVAALAPCEKDLLALLKSDAGKNLTYVQAIKRLSAGDKKHAGQIRKQAATHVSTSVNDGLTRFFVDAGWAFNIMYHPLESCIRAYTCATALESGEIGTSTVDAYYDLLMKLVPVIRGYSFTKNVKINA